jgi:hypothetical protein
MAQEVNTLIPEELKKLCAMIDMVDDDARDLWPPELICRIVNSDDQDEANQIYLDEWLDNRNLLQERLEMLTDQLPEGDPSNIPLWRAQPFALALSFPWGAGLAKAITDCEKWLAAQTST